MKKRIMLALLAWCASVAVVFADDLEQSFTSPPQSAKPQTWWHWMNGNITREGITADLEAMRRVGLGGAQIFNVDGGIPPGPVKFMSPQWREMVRYAAQQADRLGLELSMHNCAGWSSSGGPWNTPEHGMQIVVSGEKQVQGPAQFDAILPVPRLPSEYDCYRDIAVLAFPTPAGEAVRMNDFAPKVTTSHQTADGSKVIDGDHNTSLLLPVPKPNVPQYIQLEFARPYPARLLILVPGRGMLGASGKIEVSDDGKSFRTVQSFTLPRGEARQAIAFAAVSARFYRVLFTSTSAGMKQLPIAEVELLPRLGIENLTGKAFYNRAGDYRMDRKVLASPDEMVNRDAIVDLSNRLTAAGNLTWDVPQGNWTILRVGYAPNGQVNHPSSAEGSGLECDKLSKEAVEAHWAAMMGKVIEDLGPLAGKTLHNVVIDSYEIGTQNWTPQFRQQFQRRRGYDLLRFLPVLSGRVVDSPAVTERFLWDLRRTVADLFAENYSGHFAALAHRHGLKYSVEPYGSCPCDDLQYGGPADIPMAEFWVGKGVDGCTRLAASIGHTYGRKYIGAEAFTAGQIGAKWDYDPYGLKALGDAVYCGGVNRFIFHTFTHQPWLDRFPGLTMAACGTHFERTVTWWEQSAAWLRYLARCQSLLQQGLFVADVCFFAGESVPGSAYGGNLRIAGLPKGHDFDGLSAEVLLSRLSVSNGRLVLPDGMSYRLLVLPPGDTMTPPTLRKIKELADAGATIVGPKPARSPSLSGYPACDAEVQRLADDLWQRGKVLPEKPLEDLFAAIHLKPDFEAAGTAARISYIHRVVNGADVYFLSNQQPSSDEVACTFRVAGKVPELWHPDTGRIEKAPLYTEQDGRISVPLRFDPAGSLFVVFRTPAGTADHLVSVRRAGASQAEEQPPTFDLAVADDGQLKLRAWQPGVFELKTAAGKTFIVEVREVAAPLEICGPWQLGFPPNWGAPEKVTLDKLISWTAHADGGVKYFSGTATYAKGLDIPANLLGPGKELYLDLGRLKNIAEVRLNGENLGLLWKPPFCVEISGAAHAGSNRLEIQITNLWPNRLIGDEQLPADCQWIGTRLSGWPQWLLDGKRSPTGRLTFPTRHLWTKGDTPLESGLLGPVMLRSAKKEVMAIGPHAAAAERHDVVVYGGTSAGVTAAVQAARMGKSVVLIEPGKHLGGMTSSGLGMTDNGATHTIGGLALEFYRRVYRYYTDPKVWKHLGRDEFVAWLPNHWGVDGRRMEQMKAQFLFEPHAAEKVFGDMVREAGVKVVLGERLNLKQGVKKDGPEIVSITMESGRVFAAKMFVDATYEGDLMAQSGVTYFVGREPNSRYGETLNGIFPSPPAAFPRVDPYIIPGDRSSGLLPRIEPASPGKKGDGDRRNQAFNFRLCLTDVPENRVPFVKPAAYDPQHYELLARYIATLKNVRPGKARAGATALRGDNLNLGICFDLVPNRKTDSNCGSEFGSDLYGVSYQWAEADYARRGQIWQQHKDYTQGLLWFLANDPRVPEPVREEMQRWGLAKDEFTDTDHWPFQIYVREARRLQSDYVVAEHDARGTRVAEDAVALASYPLDSHGVSLYVDEAGVLHRERGFYVGGLKPFPISYRALRPRAEQCSNLLVPGCLSASHAAYGSIRMEPVFMMLGQAAGTAAGLAVDGGVAVQAVPYPQLRERLLADQQIIEWAPQKQ